MSLFSTKPSSDRQGVIHVPALPYVPSEDQAIEPDECGRLRVLDEDTGHRLSIPAATLPHGNFTVLDEPASALNGDALPPEHYVAPAPLIPPVEPNPSGQQADSKENAHG